MGPREAEHPSGHVWAARFMFIWRLMTPSDGEHTHLMAVVCMQTHTPGRRCVRLQTAPAEPPAAAEWREANLAPASLHYAVSEVRFVA